MKPLKSNFSQVYGNEFKAKSGYEWLEGFIPSGCSSVLNFITLTDEVMHEKKDLSDVSGSLVYHSREVRVFVDEYYYEEEDIPHYDIFFVFDERETAY